MRCRLTVWCLKASCYTGSSMEFNDSGKRLNFIDSWYHGFSKLSRNVSSYSSLHSLVRCFLCLPLLIMRCRSSLGGLELPINILGYPRRRGYRYQSSLKRSAARVAMRSIVGHGSGLALPIAQLPARSSDFL
jgi:hypothetical protein